MFLYGLRAYYNSRHAFYCFIFELMHQDIEISIKSEDGIADCQLETEDGITFSALILYPHQVEGIYMSKVYEYTLVPGTNNTYTFSEDDIVHPKIKPLETQLSDAILNNR